MRKFSIHIFMPLVLWLCCFNATAQIIINDTLYLGLDKSFEEIFEEDAFILESYYVEASGQNFVDFGNSGVIGLEEGVDTLFFFDEQTETLIAQVNLEVFPFVELISLALSPQLLEMRTGELAQVNFTLNPQDASYYDLNWSSSDDSVAIIDQNGNVQALSPGTTIISLTLFPILAEAEMIVRVSDSCENLVFVPEIPPVIENCWPDTAYIITQNTTYYFEDIDSDSAIYQGNFFDYLPDEPGSYTFYAQSIFGECRSDFVQFELVFWQTETINLNQLDSVYSINELEDVRFEQEYFWYSTDSALLHVGDTLPPDLGIGDQAWLLSLPEDNCSIPFVPYNFTIIDTTVSAYIIEGTIISSASFYGVVQLISYPSLQVINQSVQNGKDFSFNTPSEELFVVKILPLGSGNNTAIYYGNTSQIDDAIKIKGGAYNIGGIEVDLEKAVGIQNYLKPTYNVFPNPVRSILNVKMELHSLKSISVYNQIGVLMDLPITQNNYNELQIDCTNLEKGMYFIRFNQEVYSFFKE